MLFGPGIHRSSNDDGLFSRYPLSPRAEFGIWERGREGPRRALGLRLLHVPPPSPAHTPQRVPAARSQALAPGAQLQLARRSTQVFGLLTQWPATSTVSSFHF